MKLKVNILKNSFLEVEIDNFVDKIGNWQVLWLGPNLPTTSLVYLIAAQIWRLTKLSILLEGIPPPDTLLSFIL